MRSSHHSSITFDEPPEATLLGEVAAMPFYERAGRTARSRKFGRQRVGRQPRSKSPNVRHAKTCPSDPGQAQFGLRYPDMLRSAVDWLWETDSQLNLTNVLPLVAGDESLPKQLMAGRNLHDLPSLGSAASGSLSKAITERRPFRIEAITRGAGEGTTVRCRLTGVPYFDNHTGRLAGYRGTGTSMPRVVSPTRRETGATGQPAETRDEAGSPEGRPKANRGLTGDDELQDRLASVAHELRTPLNAILGFASVMMDRHFGNDTGRYREYGDYIHDSSVHLLEIVNSLADLAMNDHGQQSLQDESLDVAELAASALRMLGDEARQANVSMANELPAHLQTVRGDRRAVRQILLNLLGNAIKYNQPEGSVGIDGEAVLKLTVWDTGIGIAPENQDKVFQRSYRAPEVRSDTPGSGLGLAISRDLARAMGGEITIDSQPGQGSRVSLWLPLERAGPGTSSPQRPARDCG